MKIGKFLTALFCAASCVVHHAEADMWEGDVVFEQPAMIYEEDIIYGDPEAIALEDDFPPSYVCLPYPVVADVTIAFDNFRSLPEGSWEGNTGGLFAVNLGMPIPGLSCCDLGFQLGGSYGVYDWAGRGSTFTGEAADAQQQGFVTAGIFRKCCFFNLALATDWMFNDNFGQFALDPILGQVRYIASYLVCAHDEVGVWGTNRVNTAHKVSDDVPVSFRAISQVNLFWQHHFINRARTMIWAGAPYERGLLFTSGRAGNFTVGASFKVPLTQSLSVEGHGSYMGGRKAPNNPLFRNYASNVCIGLTYTFGSADCCDDKRVGYSPYMPIANNSNFIADTNLNY